MKMKEDLRLLSATEAIRKIKNREITAKQYVESCISQIEKHDGKIHAWVVIDKKKALESASELDERVKSDKPIGMMAGIPIGIKDVFNTKDFPTRRGSPIYSDYNAGNDARVVFRLRQEDAIVPGKTVTAELSVHTPGPTVNPHDFKHSPGTSSSGSAAAVASFMVPLALGTQTAGSTTRPASYCGIYGFKPSFGLIPRTAMLKTTDTLDHVAFFARTIEDLDLMFDAIRVTGEDYPLANNLNRPDRKPSAKWRVAFVKGPKWELAKDYAKRSMLDFSARLSKDSNVALNEVELPAEFDEVHEIHEKIYCKCLAYYFWEEYEEHKHQLSKIFVDMIEKGQKISTEEYQELLAKQANTRDQLTDFFRSYDAIITLTTAGEGMPDLYETDIPDTCLIWTFCGAPSMSLPAFKSPNGLPFGLQIVGMRRTDKDLIEFAKFLKKNGYIPDVEYPKALQD